MREVDRPAKGHPGATLEAEASAGAITALCLLALAGSTWLAQQEPTGTIGAAGTLTAAVAEVLRWELVIGSGLRGLGGLVRGGLTRPCGRFSWEAYGAFGAGTIWLAGSALAYASRTPEAALWAAFLLAVLTLATFGLSVPVVRWLADHHRRRLAERLATARRAAARAPAPQRAGPTSDDG